MSNFKRYTMVIRRDADGFATPALKVRKEGDVLKFDEVKELLQTDNQHTQPKICAHFVQFDDCVFFPGDMACGREACAIKSRRLRAGA